MQRPGSQQGVPSATVAPAAASPRATPAPMPELAPVTKARWPDKSR
jgi:hypothetical protein